MQLILTKSVIGDKHGAIGLNKVLISLKSSSEMDGSASASSGLCSLDTLLLFFGLLVCFAEVFKCRCVWGMLASVSSTELDFGEWPFIFSRTDAWLSTSNAFLILLEAGGDTLLWWRCSDFCGEEGGVCLAMCSVAKTLKKAQTLRIKIRLKGDKI